MVTMSFVDFYRHEAEGPGGHRLRDIWSWDNERLEEAHGWVSWLFPSARPSDFDRESPILNDAIVEAFEADAELRASLGRSFGRFLTFLGLEQRREGAAWVTARGPLWPQRKEVWLVPGDHNFRRITRALEALASLGLKERAEALLVFLERLAEGEGHPIITEASLTLWRRAVGLPPNAL